MFNDCPLQEEAFTFQPVPIYHRGQSISNHSIYIEAATPLYGRRRLAKTECTSVALHSMYTDTKVHSEGRKADKTHRLTYTYIPFLYLDSIGTVLRQGHTVTKAMWKHTFLLENLLLLKPCRPKTNLWEFMADSRSWLYRFYNGDKCIMLFT